MGKRNPNHRKGDESAARGEDEEASGKKLSWKKEITPRSVGGVKAQEFDVHSEGYTKRKKGAPSLSEKGVHPAFDKKEERRNAQRTREDRGRTAKRGGRQSR